MRIQQVIKVTGLSKRAIHHYIKEKLITPVIDQRNGYFIFSNDDINRLTVVRLLRTLDLSLANIRNILNHPKMANYYLTKTLRDLNRQKSHMAWQEGCVKSILDGLNQEPTWEQLFLLMENAPSPPDKNELGDVLDIVDARMLSLYFLGKYMHDIEMTEYRRYLWDKLLRYVASPQNKHLIPICEYLFSLNTEKIKSVFIQRDQHMDYIASLTAETQQEYIKYMTNVIQSNIRDYSWISNWKRAYEPYLLPSIIFYDSPANELMQEISPRFSAYVKNIHVCCTRLRKFLDTAEGLPLLNEMRQVFGRHMDIDNHHYGILESMISFKNTMYK